MGWLRKGSWVLDQGLGDYPEESERVDLLGVWSRQKALEIAVGHFLLCEITICRPHLDNIGVLL